MYDTCTHVYVQEGGKETQQPGHKILYMLHAYTILEHE